MKLASDDNRYYHFFGITDSPFSIAPDPHYLFLGEKHQEALAHLFYGIGNEGGFIVLTGEVGTGKTTICRTILQQMPDDTDVAYIVNPRLDANELLESICDELGLFYDAEERTNKVMLDVLTKFLLASHSRGRHTLLIIDEAQNLSADVLEQIRLLTNLETNEKKLLQLVLIGQPELADILASRELRQLSQRVTARYHLETLSRTETANYIAHRLKVAGFQGPLFTAAALWRVYRATGGVPRLINVLCERCLLGAYVNERRCIDAGIVKSASRELSDPERKGRRLRRKLTALSPARLLMPALATLVLGLGIYYAPRLQLESVASPGVVAVAQAEEMVIPAAPATLSEPVVVPLRESESTLPLESPSVVKTVYVQQREQALRRLAARWNITVPEGVPVCESVLRAGLACLELELTPKKIAALGLPGVIERRAGEQQHFTVLETAGELRSLAQQLDDPARFWLFWRSPPVAAKAWPYILGDQHDGVYWLQQRLNWYQGNKHYWLRDPSTLQDMAVRDRFDWLYSNTPALSVSADRGNFSDALQDELKALQQQLGWRATGQGDLLTLLKLDTLTNTRAPSLVHSG